MRKIIFASLIIVLIYGICFAQEAAGKTKIALFITEQNIESPKTAWWASEVDLSATEAVLAKRLSEIGLKVFLPVELAESIKKEKAFRLIELQDSETVRLGAKTGLDFILLGKAIASAGGVIPDSSMRSCFANITLKLISVKSSKVIQYIEASGKSAHLDVITGGKEALDNAANNLFPKIQEALNKLVPAQEIIKNEPVQEWQAQEVLINATNSTK